MRCDQWNCWNIFFEKGENSHTVIFSFKCSQDALEGRIHNVHACYILHCFVAASNVKNAFTLINGILFTPYIPCAHNAIRIEVMLSDLSYIWHKVGPLMMQVTLISSTRCKKVRTICVIPAKTYWKCKQSAWCKRYSVWLHTPFVSVFTPHCG